MQVITIQHRNVLAEINATGMYKADIGRVPDNRVQPYIDMCKYYGWEGCPIFGSEIGQRAILQDGKYIEGVALQLDIPDEFVRRQYYYDWCDLIYFTEFPDEFASTFDLSRIPDIETYKKLVFDFTDMGSYDIFQVAFPFIKREWVVAVSQDPITVIEFCEGNPILETLIEYDPFTTEFVSKSNIFIRD